MKTKIYLFRSSLPVLIFMLLVSWQSYAADYTVSFAGTGAATNVDSVVVQNITKGTKVSVPAGGTLALSAATSIDQSIGGEHSLRIYPNPIQVKSTVTFYAKQAGNAQIDISGVDGKKYGGVNRVVNAGENSFQLSLPKGAFIIKIAGVGCSYVGKAISQSDFRNEAKISFTENAVKMSSASQEKTVAVQLRSAGATGLQYTDGDHLLYKGYSGLFSTVLTDVPTESKTVTFTFANCTAGASAFFEDFSWVNASGTSKIFYTYASELRFDKWTVTNGWTSTLNSGSGDQPAYQRIGFIKLGKTSYGGDLITPKMSNIVGNQDVVVKFKAVPYETKAGAHDDSLLVVSVLGAGEIVRNSGINKTDTTFAIENWPAYPIDEAAHPHLQYCIDFWDEPAATRTFTITGATSETQIKFLGRAYALSGVGQGKNRIFLDDVLVYIPNQKK